jgi:hypothetical protein
VENSFNFFFTEMHITDGQDNGLVTRKLHGAGPLINTSDVYTVSPITAIHISVTGNLPVTSNGLPVRAY